MSVRCVCGLVLGLLSWACAGEPGTTPASDTSTATGEPGESTGAATSTTGGSTTGSGSSDDDEGLDSSSEGSSGEPGSAGEVVTIQLSVPHGFDGLYMDPDGLLFGAGGWQDDEVVRIEDDGALTTFSTGHGGPIHLTLGGDGFYYVTNYTDNTLRRVSADGSELTLVAEDLDGPSGVVTAADGTVYFVGWGAPANTGRLLYRVTDRGEVVVHIDGEGLEVPQGLAADDRGNLYVANAVDGRIHQVAPDGTVSLLGELPSGEGYNVAHMVYGNGRLYATGGENNVIYAIEIGGATTVWGTGAAETIDGPLEEAAFDTPAGLAISPDGHTLWVDAGGDASLRRITLN